jgi:hypothetical protein
MVLRNISNCQFSRRHIPKDFNLQIKENGETYVLLSYVPKVTFTLCITNARYTSTRAVQKETDFF